MGENTPIEWATHTFNPWIGCTKVSPGCDHCYAEGWSKRFGVGTWGPHGERHRTGKHSWAKPLAWAKEAASLQETWERQPIVGRSRERPERPRIFCASLADVFDNQVPEQWRLAVWDLIWSTPELDWLLLTKRPENVARFLPDSWFQKGPWENVWLGFSAEDQPRFDRRWPIMREIPAVVRFCSYEPALGPLRLPDDVRVLLHWLICGGESGPHYRGMDRIWEQYIRNDCAGLGIAYFLKQWADKRPFSRDDIVVREYPKPRIRP
jgi:protein gp37